jgi:hypothetical protein
MQNSIEDHDLLTMIEDLPKLCLDLFKSNRKEQVNDMRQCNCGLKIIVIPMPSGPRQK